MQKLFEVDREITEFVLENEAAVMKFMFNLVFKRFSNRVKVLNRCWITETEYCMDRFNYYESNLSQSYDRALNECSVIVQLALEGGLWDEYRLILNCLFEKRVEASGDLFRYYKHLKAESEMVDNLPFS